VLSRVYEALKAAPYFIPVKVVLNQNLVSAPEVHKGIFVSLQAFNH